MRGVDHGLFAAAGFLGIAPLVAPHVGLPTLTLPRLAAGTVVAAGAGLLPDWDQPGATPSRTFPLVGMWIARATLKLCGKHRGSRPWFPGTHSLLSAAGFTAAAAWATGRAGWAATVGTFLLVAMCCQLISHHVLASLTLATAATAAIDHWAPLGQWTAAAAGIGVLAHLLGDMIATKPGTDGGVPLLWPYRHRFGIRLFRTGGPGEQAASVVMTVGLGALAWLRF